MSKLGHLQSLLKSKGLWAKKSLGQNFLIDEKALETIVRAADLTTKDHVIEVGPGTGFLTELLLRDAGKLTSVELDGDMVKILQERFGTKENFKLLHRDALDTRQEDFDLKADYKVVANIPYYITSPLIKHFLKFEKRPSTIVLLMQKEVAEKVCAIGGKTLLTIETQLYGEPELVNFVPSKSFYPAPKVDSAILKIKVFPESQVPEDQMKDFLRMLKFGFSQKRKKLANSLGAGLHKKPAEVKELLGQAQIDPEVRAEDLEVEDWKRLYSLIQF